MNMSLLLGLLVFVLISRRLFSFMGKQKEEENPPIEGKTKGKSIFQEIFGEVFNENEGPEPMKKVIYTKPKEIKTSMPEMKKEEEISFEIKEEDEFDLRKAVIYSTILNNPFIDEKI